MKKLMIAAAIVCAAAFANAATINWSTDYLNSNDGTDIYSMTENGYTYNAVLSIIGPDGAIDSGTYDPAGEWGAWYGTTDAGELNTQYTAKLVITESKDGKALATLTAEGVFMSSASDSFDTTIDFSTGNGFSSGSFIGNGTGKWVAAPEPTSGLLMLLGVAGLALRRRRA